MGNLCCVGSKHGVDDDQTHMFIKTKDGYERRKVIKTDDGFEFIIDPDILTCRSEYFKALFQYDNQPCISIHGVNGDSMKQILSYMVEEEISLDENNVLYILEAADYLMLEDVLQEVRTEMSNVISPSNCIEFFQASLKLKHLDITNVCYSYIQGHFEKVVENGDIGNLALEHMARFLCDKDLDVDKEETVWNAVVKWIERDPKNRIEDVPFLLTRVRLEACTDQCIQRIRSHPFVAKNETLCKIINCTTLKDFQDDNPNKHFIDAIRRLSPRAISLGPRQPVICIVSLSGSSFNPMFSDAEIAIASHKGKTISKITITTRWFFPRYVFICDQRIYTFTYLGNMFFYDLLSNYWINLPMSRFHYVSERASLVTVDQRIYAIWTGNIGSNSLNVDFYAPETNEWRKGQSLAIPNAQFMIICSAAAHEGLIYATSADRQDAFWQEVGGIYDPGTDTWRKFMLPESDNTSEVIRIVSVDKKLLLIRSNSTSVHRFYPEKGVWKSFKALPHAFSHPVALMRNEKLLIFNFHNGQDECKAVYWDQEKDQWSDGKSLFSAPSRYVIEDPDVVLKYHRLMLAKESTNAPKE